MWLCVAPVHLCRELKRVPDVMLEARLTRVFGLCSQESSDSSNTTVEDEDVKGKRKPIPVRRSCETAVSAPSLADFPANLGETWVNSIRRAVGNS